MNVCKRVCMPGSLWLVSVECFTGWNLYCWYEYVLFVRVVEDLVCSYQHSVSTVMDVWAHLCLFGTIVTNCTSKRILGFFTLLEVSNFMQVEYTRT